MRSVNVWILQSYLRGFAPKLTIVMFCLAGETYDGAAIRFGNYAIWAILGA